MNPSQSQYLVFTIVDAEAKKGEQPVFFPAHLGLSPRQLATRYLKDREAMNAFRGETVADGDQFVVAVLKPGEKKLQNAEVFEVTANQEIVYREIARGSIAEYRAANGVKST